MFLFMSFYMMLFNIILWLMFLIFLLFNFKFIIELNFMFLNSLNFEFIIYLDWMTMIFISTVLLISSIVLLYSLNYMENDKFLKRFMFLIMIFVMSMIFMILSLNLISILLGWDGLGLSSYCLVAYYQSKKSFNSSMITILMNRIGDIMILLSISLLMKFGSWNFLFLKKIDLMILIILFIATFTKSAQIPFSTWLPLAMAAPTPVSSLVHSSTLVTAGVYLLIRFNYLMNENLLYFFLLISCLTMFMSGFSANFEFDLKKIIALSTLSQLGLMISTICLNLPKIAFFHLITHAMFKSLLFLCSGIMIHNYLNNQDIRFMSFMNFNIPLINLIFNFSSLTLCGMPYLSGFYSKDLIIEMFLMNNFNWMIILMMYISMGLTLSYSLRLIFYISLKFKKMNMFNLYQSFNLMNYSIFILFFFSLFYGSIINWLMFSSLNLIFLPMKLKLMIYLILFTSFSLIFLIYLMKIKLFINNKYMIFLYKFFNLMWMLPLIFKKNKMNLLMLNNKFIIYIDNSWLETISYKFKFYMFTKLYWEMSKINFFTLMLMISYMLLIFTII